MKIDKEKYLWDDINEDEFDEVKEQETFEERTKRIKDEIDEFLRIEFDS